LPRLWLEIPDEHGAVHQPGGQPVAAHTLASAGLSVGIVEEGPWLKTKDITQDVHTAFGRVMRQAGMQVLQGRAYMPMLQGRCVGGSTLVNSAIAWRITKMACRNSAASPER